jgi:aryl sulfotransferase
MERSRSTVNTQSDLPQRVRVYESHNLNSHGWDGYTPRVGDVVIATALKAGTTWMQTIVGNLIFQDRPMPAPLWQLTPWLDARGGSPEEKLARIEGQTHPRFLKTHLPLDALPYFPTVRYIYVGRDGLDIFMSLWNHYRHLKPEVLAWLRYPPCPKDIHEFFRMWIAKSWYAWEHEGFPFWSLFYHLASWWAYRHLSNILFVHFDDLLADLEGQMRIVARYLEIEVDEALWPMLVDRVTFETMKANAEHVVAGGGDFLVGGARQFLHKGTNGRWRGVLTQEELDRYEAVATDRLDPESKRWLECGTLVSE